MNDTNVAWTRSTVNTLIGAFLVWLLAVIFDLSVELTDPVFILIPPIVGGIVYRGSRAITERFPRAGYILFGLPATPTYSDPPA